MPVSRSPRASRIAATAEGRKCGQKWARELATPKQMERLKKFILSGGGYWLEPLAPHALSGWFALEILGDKDADPEDFWRARGYEGRYIRGRAGKVYEPPLDFLDGFISGARGL